MDKNNYFKDFLNKAQLVYDTIKEDKGYGKDDKEVWLSMQLPDGQYIAAKIIIGTKEELITLEKNNG